MILFRAFEADMLPWPSAGQRALVLGAGADFRAPSEFAAAISAVQGFRPDYLSLQRSGVAVAAEAVGSAFDLALVVASRHRGESEMRLAQAIDRVADQGLVLFAGSKTDGAASLRKRLEEHVPVEGHLAKSHGIAFWLRKTQEAVAWSERVKETHASGTLVEGKFLTASGMFSQHQIDAGSHLLSQCLPSDLKGVAADFCAGWGYLSVELASRAPRVQRIDLYEADHASLVAAERNMAALAPQMPATYNWRDLVTEPVEQRYQLIVMNPPFHSGRAAEPDLGKALIRIAAKALASGGSLYLVANRNLPYEATLSEFFSRVEKLRDESGFKVIHARR